MAWNVADGCRAERVAFAKIIFEGAMKRIISILSLLALLCAFAGASWVYAGVPPTAAPSASSGLPSALDASVNTVQLLDIIAANKGKVVMINFFAAFCPPCRMEIPGLINIRELLSEDDFVIIGVSMDDDLDEMREFVSATPFNYPTYFGEMEVRYAFRASAIPFNVVYDRQGRIVVNEAGYVPEGRLVRFLRQLIAQ